MILPGKSLVSPKLPPVAAAPAPIPTRTNNPAISRAQQQEQQNARRRRNRSSTVVTGPQGVGGSAPGATPLAQSGTLG